MDIKSKFKLQWVTSISRMILHNLRKCLEIRVRAQRHQVINETSAKPYWRQRKTFQGIGTGRYSK